MNYNVDIKLKLPWVVSKEISTEEGEQVLHAECHHPTEDGKGEDIVVYIDVMAMPEDSCASEQALLNYIDIVGFEEENEDNAPIAEHKFNGKRAYIFDATCQDNSLMRVVCYSPKQNCLCIITIHTINIKIIEDTYLVLEKALRITPNTIK